MIKCEGLARIVVVRGRKELATTLDDCTFPRPADGGVKPKRRGASEKPIRATKEAKREQQKAP